MMKELIRFTAGSANDTLELSLKNASLFIEQLNTLVLTTTQYTPFIHTINSFENDSKELETIFAMYGSDKSTTHNYHILYSFILNNLGRDSRLNILEIGIGTNNPDLASTMGSYGTPGASLFSFRDYMPNSFIYGADIDKDILGESDRIKTAYVDQLDRSTYDRMSEEFGNITYDIIIDDGLHSIGANLNTLLFALDKINVNGWIIIEDVHMPDNWVSIDYILSSNIKYKTYIIQTKSSFIYAVNRIV
jgi:hypothetical protein